MIGYEGAGRYPKLIQALTGDDEIVPPGILLENDRLEYSALKNEGQWHLGLEVTDANAAHFPTVGIFSSQANGIVVITQVILTNANNNTVNYKIGLVSPAILHSATTPANTSDSRRLARIARGFTSGPVLADPFGAGWSRFAPATTNTIVIPLNIVIVGTNFDFIVMQTTGGGTGTTDAMFFGYERAARPEELTQ